MIRPRGPAFMRSALRACSALALLAVGLPATVGCVDGGTASTPPQATDVQVLFVGNSLTAANDLPAMVAELAEADGVDLPYAVQTFPNYALGDHWNVGLADAIGSLSPEIVVLQQGPSSLSSSRTYLLEWTETIDGEVRAAGGRSALFMVWPDADRTHAFDAVRDHYAEAAALVEGIFIPAGETWRSTWSRQPDLGLYGPDGFHPSRTGSVAAALTIWAMLREEGEGPPACHAEVLVDEGTAKLLCEAMREAVEEWGVR